MKIINIFTLIVCLTISFSSFSGAKIGTNEKNKIDFKQLFNSAKQGDRAAQYKLGFTYQTLAFMQNNQNYYKQAVYWYENAANSGHPTAQSKLGLMYAKGTGIIQDTEKAKYWLKKSYKNGDKATSDFAKMIYEQELNYGHID